MDPITILHPDLHPLLFSSLRPQEYLTSIMVNSTWNGVVKNLLNKKFFSEYIPVGESFESYQTKHCVGSTTELKGRIQKFMKRVNRLDFTKRAIFVCSFPFNESPLGTPSCLAIKSNLLATQHPSDPIPMHQGFISSDAQAIHSYILSRTSLNHKQWQVKDGLLIEVCFAKNQLKETTNSPLATDCYPSFIESSNLLNGDYTLMLYSGDNRSKQRDLRLLKQIEKVFSRHMLKEFYVVMITALIIVTFLGILSDYTGTDQKMN